LGNERRKQRDQRRKVEHNTQGLHTMERVISSSLMPLFICVG
jgi:hypothetical protein